MLRILQFALVVWCLTCLATNAQVTAAFTITPPANGVHCNPALVYFTSTSTGGPLTHKWNFGVMAGVQSNLQNPNHYYFGSGTFTVTLIVTHNLTGVSDTAKQLITIHNTPFPAFGMDDTTVCANGTVFFKDFSILNGNIVSFNWNFADPSSGASNSSALQNPTHVYTQPGTYNVSLQIVTAQGCSAATTNQVIIGPAPIITVSNDTSICVNASAQLHASGAPQFSWSPATGLSSTAFASPVASPSSTTTYTVTGSDATGCSASATVVVNVVTTGSANAGDDQYICFGSSVNLFATGLTTYAWSPSTGLNDPYIANPVATPPLTQVYTVSGADQNGCTVSDTVVVYVAPVPVADAGSDLTICEGQSTYLQGNGGNNFQWSPSSGLLGANSFLAFVNPSTTTTYTLTVSNGGACVDADTVVVTVLPKPSVNATNPLTICPGGTANLTATGATSYLWSPAAGLSQNNIANPQALAGIETSYIVTGTAANGCTDTAHVNIYLHQPKELVAHPGGVVCPNEPLQLYASGMLSYEWMPATGLDNPYVPEPYAAPPHSITYKVKGFDGCYFDSAFVHVKINDEDAVAVGPDLQTFPNNPVFLQAAGNGSFTWYPPTGLSCTDCPDPIATVSQTTTYVVINNNPDGCRTEDTIVVHVNCLEAYIFVPNAFTPNGDGRNERFFVRTRGLKKLDFFRVYTRTGEMVFETSEVDRGWDGTFKGCALPPGVFSYHAIATCEANEKIEFSGNVTLIR